MKRYFFPFLLCLLAMAFLSQAIPTQQITGASVSVPTRPFPQHVTYASGTIRPTNFTQAQQDSHVRDFYDYWKTNYLVAAGTNGAGQQMYRVAFGVGSDITVSEGQGYGMVIVALMAGHDADAQALLDGLWYFAREYPSGIDNRLMSWKVQNGTIVDGNDSAFDGDVDIAYGLLLADAQWGSDGNVDYEAKASQVIDGILESTIGESSRLPMLGDWVDDNGGQYSQYTPRSSDFMPAHFRAFARAKNDPVWETVITNSQTVIDSVQANHSPVTGLLPDFIINCSNVNNCAPASAGFLEGPHDGHYYYNAGRDPWRIGLDALLNDDAGSRAEVQKMVSWVASASAGNANQIKAGYQLDGTTIGDYFTTFFVAPFGVGAMLDASQQPFLNDIYASVYNAQENYYEDSVNLLALLAMTGNYWDPTASLTPPATNTPGPSPTASKTPSAVPPTSTATATATPLGGATCSVTYTITSDWGVGFNANVSFINNTGADINGWTLTWTFPGNQQITSSWDGQHSQSGNQVEMDDASWNASVPDGGSASFGFGASYSGTNDVPTDFALNNIPCNEPINTPTPTLTATASSTPTVTPTGTLPTSTPTATATSTHTPTPLATATHTGTALPTSTQMGTALPTATQTGTALPTSTQTGTALPTSTQMGTALPTSTQMGTALPTATQTETALPTATQTGTALPTATQTGTALPTSTQTETALPTATHTTTAHPTATHTATNTPPPNAGSCTIDYAVTSQWNTGFNVSVIINNNSGADIEGWTLTWSFAGNQQITSLWNGQYTQDGTQVTVTNESYNSSIPNGGTQSFGFQGSYSGPNETPPDFVLNGIPCNGPQPTATPEPPTGPSCMVDYTPGFDWGIGFVANLIISNNSGTTWDEWRLTWSFSGNQQISNLWNGNVTQTGNQVSVENASSNGHILHESTVNLGFQASYNGNNTPPSDFAVNGQPCNGITPTPTNTPAANAPTIEQLLPAQGANSLPNEINLFGSHLQADTTVSMNLGPQRSPRLGQMPLASTFINATHLRVVIPAGLLPQSYHLTVENPDGSSSTLIGGYTVTEAEQDDLFSNPSQLWNIPSTLRAGDEAQLGLLVYREGGSETLQKVRVSFYLTDENDVQDTLGTGEIPLLAPNSSQSTIPLTWTVPAAGDYTLYALIDEANHISETNESNNVIVRPLTILPTANDVTPPTIDDFTINNGATETSSQDVELSISATDAPPPPQSWGGMRGGTGVESVYIIEYEYNQALSLWIPAQLSDWQPYSPTLSSYDWTLLPIAGLKYLQIWAADGAGNISLMPQSALINYLPANTSLATGLSHFYAYDLAAGESLSASLTPTSGDPDLYLWSPNGAQSWFSINEGSEVDEVTLNAPATGRYMLQVHAYQSADYSLSVTLGAAQASHHHQQQAQGKTPLSQPGLAPEALPDALTHALPSAPLSNEPTALQYKIHLPVIVR